MDSIMKFVLMNGETENIKDVYTGDSIPPFYKEAFDEFSQYKFVGVVSVSPADLLNVKGIDNELDMEQVRDSRDVSEELISKLNTKGFDGARLILTEKINGKYVVLSGHSRLKYSIEKYKQILIYVVESTESDYDVHNTLDLQAALNAENDVADKVTVENIINIAHVKMNRNLGRSLVLGMPNSPETINWWLRRIGAHKQYKGIDGGQGGLARVYKDLARTFSTGTPEEVGITPMPGKDQRDSVERMQNKAPDGHAWISLDVSSGATTNSQALVGRVAKCVAAGAEEINIVVGSNEQDSVAMVHWNRYLLIEDFFDKINETLVGLAKLVDLKAVRMPQESWEKKIKLWTFANTMDETKLIGIDNPYGFAFPLVPTSLGMLETKASQGINKTKYLRRKKAA